MLKKEKIKLLGYTNVVGPWDSIKRVLFFDTDTKYKYYDITDYLRREKLMGIIIETTKGYHIVSPAIMSYSEFVYHFNNLFKIFPETDYLLRGRLNQYGIRYNVLRSQNKPGYSRKDLRIKAWIIPNDPPSSHKLLSFNHLLYIMNYTIHNSFNPLIPQNGENKSLLEKKGYKLIRTNVFHTIIYYSWRYINE